MNFTTLTLHENDGIALLTLNRPDKRNAISYELIADLQSALDAAEKSPSQVLVITGAGKAFSSGMDLENLKSLTGRTPEQNIEDSRTMARLFRSIYDFPKPTIAAVNGPAIAGGTGIATICDFTLATHEAKFGYTEVRIGFVPAIVSNFLVRQVGEKQARDLLLTGRIFAADEALRLGLVNEIVDPNRLLPRAHELARMLMENSPASLRATKQLLSQTVNEELDRRLETSIEENARIRQTADFREGISAFLEKRKPHWSSR
jgi:methylglutaconyl-CoA hydratase